MFSHFSHSNSMLSSSLNDYTNFLKLENNLLLANDRIKSLECLLASKDFVIYHMHMCNAYVAQFTGSPTWRPPPPSDSPLQKESNFAAENCSQSSTSSAESPQSKSKSADFIGRLPKQMSQFKRRPTGDLKPMASASFEDAALFNADADTKEAIFVESQMRQGGKGGSRLTIDPRKPLLPRPRL